MADRLDVDVIVEAISKGFDKVNKDLDRTADEAEDLGRSAEKSSGGVSAMNVALGNMAAQGLMTAGRALVQFGMDSISAASDVEEMSSKFEAVFKDLASGTEADLATMADAINRSKFDLMGYAATFQDTFVPLGFAREAAADMSTQLVLLAEDLASFNNLNTEDVVRDLQSALVGNTETLRKYGVVAQETQIKAKALEMGLWDGKGAIEAQAKAATILQLTIEGTSDAQGDAARTSESYANKMKGLEAAMKDVQVVIGTALLPALVELADHATVAADRLSQALKITGDYGNELDKLVDKQIDENRALEDMTADLKGLEKALNVAWGLGGLITGTFGNMEKSTLKYGKEIAKATTNVESFELALKDMMGEDTLVLFKRLLENQQLSTEEFYNMATAGKEWEDQLAEIKSNTERWAEATEDSVGEIADSLDKITDVEIMNALRGTEELALGFKGLKDITFTELAKEVQENIAGVLNQATGSSNTLAYSIGELKVALKYGWDDILGEIQPVTDILGLTKDDLEAMDRVFNPVIELDTKDAEEKLSRLNDMFDRLGSPGNVPGEYGSTADEMADDTWPRDVE